jgi:hypothetical protein
MTAPFGPSQEYLDKKRLRETASTPQAAAMSLMAWAQGMQGKAKAGKK